MIQPAQGGNGNHRVLKWIAGIIASVVAAACGVAVTAWADSIHTTASKIEHHTERIGRIEEREKGTERRLERIENKVDTVLWELRKRP